MIEGGVQRNQTIQPTGDTGGTIELARDTSKAYRLVQRFRLRVVQGPDAGATVESKGDRLVIGSHEGADLVLHDRTVSTFHCAASFRNDLPLITDLESLNGTVVDGTSVLAAHLRNGSIITIGRTQIRFETGGDQVRIPLSQKDGFASMVGRSAAMREVFALLERAAASDVTVLLEGETGTGKEAAAESIHAESARRDKPFIVVDCGAIPPSLIESELFGHARGAFTGAVAARQGSFEAAWGGTLFLDEIGELGLELQPKLLRALERREIKRVGESKYFAVDTRVIAATNRNLRTQVNAGQFRSDLYYRLAVLEIRLPPLRERREDLSLLVQGFLRDLGINEADSAQLRTPEFEAELRRHSWPGNVRELRNYIERCLTLNAQPPIASEPSDSSENAGGAAEALQPFKTARDTFEKRYLQSLLRWHENNVSAAAKAAGIDRANLYRMLWRHRLR